MSLDSINDHHSYELPPSSSPLPSLPQISPVQNTVTNVIDIDIDTVASEQEVRFILNTLQEKLIAPFNRHENDLELFQRYRSLFGANRADQAIDYEDIEVFFIRYQSKLMEVEDKMDDFGMLDDRYPQGREYRNILNTLKEALTTAKHMVVGMCFSRTLRDPHSRALLPDEAHSFVYYPPVEEKEDRYEPFRQLLKFFNQEAYKRGFRKDKPGKVYQPVRSSNGESTGCWKLLYDNMKDFVTAYLPSEHENYPIYKASTSPPSNVDQVIKRLEIQQHPKFPLLNRCRYKFQFRNGTWYSHKCLWIPLGHSHPVDASCQGTAINYFDLDFDYDTYLRQLHQDCGINAECRARDIDTPLAQCKCGDFMNVVTSAIQRTFNDQNFSKDVCRIMYMIAGRQLEFIRKRENHQFAAAIIGTAGTGKSSFLDYVKDLLPPELVATLDDYLNRDFGLASLMGKLALFADDVSDKNNWDVGMINKIICGGTITTNEKHGDIKTNQRWNQHFMVSANSRHLVADKAGSSHRRWVYILYKNIIKADPSLPEKLHSEIPAWLFKISMAYTWWVESYNNVDVWSVMPKEVLDTREESHNQSHPIAAFVNSHLVTLGASELCKWDDFMNEYNEFCTKMKYTVVQLTPDNYDHCFKLKGLKKLINSTQEEHKGSNHMMTTDWIQGISIKRIENEWHKRMAQQAPNSSSNGVHLENSSNVSTPASTFSLSNLPTLAAPNQIENPLKRLRTSPFTNDTINNKDIHEPANKVQRTQ